MALLTFPRIPFMEFYLNSQWVNVIEHVRQKPGVKIERARKNEQAKPNPSECTFWLDDSSEGGNGDYTSRNPLGQYYPHFRKNVPLRYGYEIADDNFDDRTSSAGWLGNWINGRAIGGTIADGDWQVNGGVAQHIIPAENQIRGSTYNSFICRNGEQRVTWTRPNSNVTGGPEYTAFQFRILDPTFTVSTYLVVEFSVDTAENLGVRVYEIFDGSSTEIKSITTLMTTAPQTVHLAAQLDGNTVRSKAWKTTDPEPLAWQSVAPGVTLATPGYIGIRSQTDAANTNADPHTHSYENWSFRHNRFSGEATSIIPDMDLSENVRVAKIEASTLFRRHQQGSSPTKSAFRRYVESKATQFNLYGYWPCEDGRFTNAFASGLPNGSLMILGAGAGSATIFGGGLNPGNGDIEFAADEKLFSSAALPYVNSSTWVAYPTDSGDFSLNPRYEIRFYMSMPGSQPTLPICSLELFTTNQRWLFNMGSGVGSIQAFDVTGSILVDDNFPTGYPAFNNSPRLWRIALEQQGAGNIAYIWSYITVNSATPITYISGSLPSKTLTRIYSLGLITGSATGSPDDAPKNTVIGHIMIGNTAIGSSGFGLPLAAFVGETACVRLERLRSENNLPVIGQMKSTDSSALMGPQNTDKILNLLTECADTDHGIWMDSRGDNSYSYIPLSRLYDRDPVITLDHDLFHLAPEFKPADDDATTVNDVTVKAKFGSTANQTQSTGPLNTSDPGTNDDAAGLYDKSFTINPSFRKSTDENSGPTDQLVQSAGWLLNLGTVDEARFPEINVDLGTPSIKTSINQTLAVLDLDPGDVMEIINLQPWYIFDTVEQLVLGYTEHSDTVFGHQISFNTAPYSPYNVGKVGGDSSLDLEDVVRLDSSDSTLDADISDTDTTFDVNTAHTNTRWIISTDQIVTSRSATVLAGTTTTARLSGSLAIGLNNGDKIQLYDSSGVLKEATVFTVSNVVTAGVSDRLITFAPAAAVGTALGDIVRSWFADNFNFDITIGGERMTVTGITGTGPQTFTVVRGVNGVQIVHSAGDKVSLFNPYKLAK